MPKKIALDWDEYELRLVAAQCSGNHVKVTDAAVIPLEDQSVRRTLEKEVESRGWSKADALVAIGRGKAELRELQLPNVPDEELPDMVRFQAIRTFASAGDSSSVDYLVTRRDEGGVEMIAAAIGPAKKSEVQEACEKAGLTATRMSLRPLCSSALFFIKSRKTDGEIVLIDLLSDEAEIVIAQDGSVVFVRTVKLPVESSGRARALAGELRRSLLACGSTAEERRVILWGKSAVHGDDIEELSRAAGEVIETLDPFSLVDVDRGAAKSMTDHVGRLAPLVGLLAADELHADRLVDFLQPRKRPEPKSNRGKMAAMIGVPIAACLLLAFGVYRQFSSLDDQIENLQAANDDLQPQIKLADASIADASLIDQFLDGNVNWLNEMQRVAEKIPPSEQLILRQISGRTDLRKGGGKLTIAGGVTDPQIIPTMETALRDDSHTVEGGGSSEGRSQEFYRWGFREIVTVPPEIIRTARYEAYEDLLSRPTSSPEKSDSADEQSDSGTGKAEDSNLDESASEQPSNEQKDVSDPEKEEASTDPNPFQSTQSDQSRTTPMQEVAS